MCCVEGRGCADGRCTALPRRDAGLFRGIVNCRPARRLDLAGFSSGTGVCARGERREVIRNAEFGMRNWGAGDERARHCGSVAAVCRRFAHGIAVLLERLAFGSRLSFFLCQEKRDGLRCLAFLFRRVEIAIRAFSRCWRGYLPWLVHFGIVRLFVAISTGLRPESAIRKGTPFSCNVAFAINL